MSARNTPVAEDVILRGYVVPTPRSSDVLSVALHVAFDDQGFRPDDFSSLLRQIDLADRSDRLR